MYSEPKALGEHHVRHDGSMSINSRSPLDVRGLRFPPASVTIETWRGERSAAEERYCERVPLEEIILLRTVGQTPGLEGGCFISREVVYAVLADYTHYLWHFSQGIHIAVSGRSQNSFEFRKPCLYAIRRGRMSKVLIGDN